jgi:hypothetical protein
MLIKVALSDRVAPLRMRATQACPQAHLIGSKKRPARQQQAAYFSVVYWGRPACSASRQPAKPTKAREGLQPPLGLRHPRSCLGCPPWRRRRRPTPPMPRPSHQARIHWCIRPCSDCQGLVTKKARITNVRTSTAKPFGSSVTVATAITAIRLLAKSRAVGTLYAGETYKL